MPVPIPAIPAEMLPLADSRLESFAAFVSWALSLSSLESAACGVCVFVGALVFACYC